MLKPLLGRDLCFYNLACILANTLGKGQRKETYVAVISDKIGFTAKRDQKCPNGKAYVTGRFKISKLEFNSTVLRIFTDLQEMNKSTILVEYLTPLRNQWVKQKVSNKRFRWKNYYALSSGYIENITSNN